MKPEEKKMQRIIAILEERGKKSVELSKKIALQDKTGYEPLNEAIRFFVEEFWFDVLHPALISIACDAVGGDTEKTVEIGAAIVLLAGAADIHDDIIDQSLAKEPIPTVFGKFGRDIAILAGDALLIKGLYALYQACISLEEKKRQEVLETVKRAFFEICGGEAKEASIRRKTRVSGQEYLNIIRQKVAAAEATTRIGAIVGGGTQKEIDLLSHYGRTVGILMALRNEFIDMFEPAELKNRFQKESLPLPVLLALHDESRRKAILSLLKESADEKISEKILDLSIDYRETQDLIKQMKNWVDIETGGIFSFNRSRDVLTLLLYSTIEDIQ
jgi:geranylgeranyl pyrophosphate synthase